MTDRSTLENRVEHLRELAADGKNYEEISEALGLPYQNVYAMARTHGIKVVRKNKTDRALPDIKALAAQGESIVSIANKLGLSDASVRKVVKKNGIQIIKAASSSEEPKLSQARMERLAEVERLFVKEGISSAEMARMFGVSREMIRQDLNIIGIKASEAKEAQKEKQAEKIKELAEQGLITSEISEQLDIDIHMVRVIARKYDIDIPRVKEVEHGTFLSYQRGCKCDLCRAKNTEIARDQKAKRKQKGMPEELHGTDTGYRNWGCHCERCKEAGALKNQLATSLDAPKERNFAVWTPEEDELVRDYSLTARELALKLNRSIPAVNARRSKMARN